MGFSRNLFTNPMIKKLNEINTGYYLNGNIINNYNNYNLCYADDTALFSPSLKGLELMINCCEEFSIAITITITLTHNVITITT